MKGFNLATYSYTDKKVVIISYLILFLVVGLFSLYNFSSYSKSSAVGTRLLPELKSMNEELDSRQTELKGLKEGAASVKGLKKAEKLAKEIETINSIIERKAFSWSELFYSLEKATVKNRKR